MPMTRNIMQRIVTLAAAAAGFALAAAAADTDCGALALESAIPDKVNEIMLDRTPVWHDTTHTLVLTNVTLESGGIFEGVAVVKTNLVGVVPVMGTTPAVRLWAPYQQGYYTSGLFSAIEIGNLYQMLFAQRLQVGTTAYFPSPSAIRFTDGLATNDYATCRTLADVIDSVSPERVAGYLADMVSVSGDSVVTGSLSVARLFVPGCLSAESGSCRIVSAAFGDGLETPRMHIGNGIGEADFAGAALANITFGGTKESPTDNLRAYMHRQVAESVADGILAHKAETRSAAFEAACYNIATNAASGNWPHSLTTTNDYSSTLYQVNNYTAPPVSGRCAWIVPDSRTLSVWRDDTFSPPPARDGALVVTNNWQRRYKSNNSVQSSGQSTLTVGATEQVVVFPCYPTPDADETVYPLDFQIFCDYSAGAASLPTSLNWHGIEGADDWRIISSRADALTITAGSPCLLHFQQVDWHTLRVTREDLAHEL